MLSKSNNDEDRLDALNLLNSIIGYSDLLQENAGEIEQEGIIPDLQNISLAAQQLLAYVEDGIPLSKTAKEGGPGPRPKTVNEVNGRPATDDR